MTTDTKTSTTPTKGEAAVKHLWRRAVEEGDEAKATIIATVANLLQPEIKLAAGAEVPAKKKVDSAEINGQAVDLTEMEPADAEAYAAYASEMDGTAALARHVADLEERDEEDRRIGAFHDGS
jgi:hypothetical protein